MGNTYNSARRSLTVISMIFEILVMLTTALFGGVMFYVVAMLEQVEDSFPILLIETLENIEDSVGMSISDVLSTIGGLLLVAAAFALISIIISAVSIGRSKKNFVTFIGDAIFKIVINVLWAVLFALSLSEEVTGVIVYCFVIFAAPVLLSIIALCCKLPSKSSPESVENI